MKLFRVEFVSDEFDTVLVVAKNKEEAEQKAIDNCSYYFYSVDTYEVDQIDGYKISVMVYEIYNSITDEFLGYCTDEERYTTPLGRKYPLVFKPLTKNKTNERS